MTDAVEIGDPSLWGWTEADDAALYRDLCAMWAPPPRLKVSEWAERYRVVEKSVRPGPWRNREAPHLVEIMDAIHEPGVSEVVLMKGAQSGGTEALLNILGYHIHLSPSPIMWVTTSLNEAQAFSKDRFEAMRRSCEEIAEIVPAPKERTGTNTILDKQFPGGSLIFRGSNSPAGLRSHPIRILLLDEVDGYPFSTAEGEPVSLAEKRVQTYLNMGVGKIIKVSTPTDSSKTRIATAFARSDQRRYFVPCPDCEHEQVMRFAHIRWDKDEYGNGLPETAHYVCEECGSAWGEIQRLRAIRQGKWYPTAEGRPGVAGFHFSELTSLFSSMEKIVGEFLEKKEKPSEFKQWVNTVLGELWIDAINEADWEKVYGRREDYEIGWVPDGVDFLTAGVDVQATRLEVEIKGWSWTTQESWSIEHIILEGRIYEDEIWAELDGVLNRTWPREGHDPNQDPEDDPGVLGLSVMALDTGFATDRCMGWARKRPKVIPIKGSSSPLGVPISNGRRVDSKKSGKKASSGTMLWSVDTVYIKDEFFGLLSLRQPENEFEAYPDSYCHFPQYGPEYFQQLCAEVKTMEMNTKGEQKPEYRKRRERNEALDMHVYNRAAACHHGLDRRAPRRHRRKRMLEMATENRPPSAGQADSPSEAVAPETTASVSVPTRQKRPFYDSLPQRLRSSYLRR